MNNEKYTCITIEESKVIKGIAIILMVSLHVLYFGQVVSDKKYCGIKFLNINQPIEYYVGFTGQLCISVFAFLTGYAYSLKHNHEKITNIINRIKKILVPYWLILAVFCIGYYLLGLKLEWKEIFLNFITYKTNIIIFSWYINFYILLIVFFPFIQKGLDKLKFNEWFKVVAVILLSIILRLINAKINKIGIIDNCFYTNFYHFYSYLPCVLIGYYSNDLSLTIPNKFLSITVLIFIVILRCLINFKFNIGFSMDWIYIIPFICCIRCFTRNINKKSVKRIFLFLGDISLYIWLYHGFFFALNRLELLEFIYLPRFGILCVIWTIVILLPISLFTKKIVKIIGEKI